MKQFFLAQWQKAISVYNDKRLLIILLLGFSSGLPLLLTMGTLSVWLVEEGVTKATIGAFALVGLPYTFKFLWSPLIDRAPIPFLSKLLGRRRSWMLLTQFALVASLIALGTANPAQDPVMVAFLALIVAFCSASQDIVIDAYRIEILDSKSYAAGAAITVFGYRIGMLIAGAGALYLASFVGWFEVYVIMAACMGIGILAVLFSHEPAGQTQALQKPSFTLQLKSAVIDPFVDFAKKPHFVAILIFIIIYKLGDAFLMNMTNPFYLETGFTKIEIANVTKVFGVFALIFGGFVGGIVSARYGIYKSLIVCAVIHITANLFFVLQAYVGHSVPMLMFTIAAENITSGMSTTALVAYMSSLCSQQYTATQYALLSSFMSTGRTFLSASAGVFAESLGWPLYFCFTSTIAIPGILLAYWLMKISQKSNTQYS